MIANVPKIKRRKRMSPQIRDFPEERWAFGLSVKVLSLKCLDMALILFDPGGRVILFIEK